MTAFDHQRDKLQTDDGHVIHVQTWLPETTPKAVIQVLHGLGEYGDRYSRFAALANARGYAVAVHDHRGHGEHAATPGSFADNDGWNLVVGDALRVHEHLKQRLNEMPIVMLGHSMGSYLAQDFAMHYGDRLKALILSASTLASRIETFAGNALARIECWRLGEHRSSPLLDKLGFTDFNKRFSPARTELDWLSRDPDEVDKYIADPLCGGPYTAGLWRDLTAGLFRISSDDNIARVPSNLPILITGGEKDPVGGERGMGNLALHYAQTGHGRLNVKIYPDGRHEMLNELNRDQVSADWLDWIDDNA